MAAAGKLASGRGRAALLVGGALCAALFLAGCEKLSDLGVHLDFEETASAPIGTPLFTLDEEPAPTDELAPADAKAVAEPAAALADAAPDATAPKTAAAKHASKAALLPRPVAVAAMMSVAEQRVAAQAAMLEPAAGGKQGEIVEASAEELSLPAQMFVATEVAPATPMPEAAPATATVVAATAVVEEPEEDNRGISALLSDLFAPLLEPSTPPAYAGEMTVASVGVVEMPAPAPTVDTAALAIPEATAPDLFAPEAVDGDLTGLTEAEVEGLLGPPLSVRRDDPAEAWQYATNDCVLDLFFYEETGALRVVHMEARTIAALDAPADGCVKSVLAGRFPTSGTS